MRQITANTIAEIKTLAAQARVVLWCAVPGCGKTFIQKRRRETRCLKCRKKHRCATKHEPIGVNALKRCPVQTINEALRLMRATGGYLIGGRTKDCNVYAVHIYSRGSFRDDEDEYLIGEFRVSYERYQEIVMKRRAT